MDRIIETTGCDQIHAARFTQYIDSSTANNRSIYYGGALYPPEDRYDVIDGGYIAQIKGRLQPFSEQGYPRLMTRLNGLQGRLSLRERGRMLPKKQIRRACSRD